VVSPDPRPGPSPSAARSPTSVAAQRSWTPVEIRIPSVGIDAPVTPYTDAMVEAAGGWVDPTSSHAAAWWTGGGTPDPDPTNTVYVYGHVSRVPAVFNRLHTLAPGATVRLVTARGTITYRVSEVLPPVRKVDLPSDPRVNAVAPGRLVLIGCYRAPDQGTRPTTRNTVVIAEQVTQG